MRYTPQLTSISIIRSKCTFTGISRVFINERRQRHPPPFWNFIHSGKVAVFARSLDPDISICTGSQFSSSFVGRLTVVVELLRGNFFHILPESAYSNNNCKTATTAMINCMGKLSTINITSTHSFLKETTSISSSFEFGSNVLVHSDWVDLNKATNQIRNI